MCLTLVFFTMPQYRAARDANGYPILQLFEGNTHKKKSDFEPILDPGS